MTGPSVFGLPHLSEDAVAAFADGVLSSSATARARRHCAECTECAEAVRGQREAAMMLRAAGAPALPAGLLDRLAGLPMSAQLPPPPSGLPTTMDADGVPVFVAYRPGRKVGVVPDGLAYQPRPDQAGADEQRSESGADQTRAHRRVLLPVGILASAAAVVAAGAIGGTVGSVQPAINHPAAVNLVPGLVAGQPGTSGQTGPSLTSALVAGPTGPSLTSALGVGQAGPLIQQAVLRAGFRTAQIPSTP
ncbi:MAG TPA: hypothetical protein VJ851_05665 [Jatrophihabitans sp.]|nr:hypothetical protein [Jatrophihabitans sp.]